MSAIGQHRMALISQTTSTIQSDCDQRHELKSGSPPGSSSCSSNFRQCHSVLIPAGPPWTEAGSAGGMSPWSSVSSTIAVAMQKYLLSFLLTGDPNGRWATETTYRRRYGTSAAKLVFNTSAFTTQADDLANQKCLFWNKALWY